LNSELNVSLHDNFNKHSRSLLDTLTDSSLFSPSEGLRIQLFLSAVTEKQSSDCSYQISMSLKAKKVKGVPVTGREVP
jgi:hypothetical protein